jgi:glycine/D-amino acid oxidase-like deaminating enzyme
VIVGAGIVGAACARALARDGFQVVVLDGAPIGSGATAAGMGQVVVMDDSEAEFALTHYSQRLWNELAKSLPADSEFEVRGTIWVAADDEEMAGVDRKQQFYRQRGVSADVLDQRQLLQLEPQLRGDLRGGLFVPGDSVTYPPCATRWLLEQAQRLGAQVRIGASAIELSGHGVQLSDGSALTADYTINATGSWAPQLTPGLPIRPRKGHLVITDRYPGFINHQIAELGYLKSAHGTAQASVACNVQPRKTGQMLIGSSRQFDVATPEVEPPMLRRMIVRALEFLPGLGRLSAIRAWTGLRAATPDSQPLIGPHPEISGLYLATGHEGLGITTSLGTAEIIAAHLSGQPPAIAIEPYLPSRFQNIHSQVYAR